MRCWGIRDMLIPFQELFARHRVRPQGVLHLGANEGQEAAAYHKQRISTVIWVEALPDVCVRLEKHLLQWPGHHKVLCACVSDMDGVGVQFHVANNQAQSSSFLEFGTHTKEHPSVKWVRHETLHTVRVDTLFAKHGVELLGDDWFLNVDLQGAELLALRGMGDLLRHFRWAYIEVNERGLYKGCPLVGDVDAFMDHHGFTGAEVRMTDFGWGDKLYIRS